MTKRSTGLLTTLHALVDALCACCVFLIEPGMESDASMLLFVAYNALAFVTQPFVGWWADCKNHHINLLTVAVGLLSVGGLLTLVKTYLALSVSPFLIVLLIGIGNSGFHVYGGKYVAESTGNDSRHLGIFVSSGALGLAVGSQYVSILTLICIMLLMLSMAVLFLRLITRNGFQPHSVAHACIADEKALLARGSFWLVAFIVLIVFLRSFLGSMIPAGTGQMIPCFALCSVILAVTGKAFGGFIARKFGVWQTLITVMLAAGASFLLGSYHPVFFLAMVLLINCSMPLTLHLNNRILRGRQGFSFGLLAAVLAPGVALAQICQDSPLINDLLYALIATVIIEFLVLLALHERRWQVLSLSVVMNVLTNIPLNCFVIGVLTDLSLPVIILLEGIVVAMEIFIFQMATRNWRQSIRYSLTCNVCSYACGLLFEILFM